MDVKRFEKLLKRFKPLLDDKLKLKQRLRGLQSFLEISTEPDELKVFQENDEAIFNVLHEALYSRRDKIKERAANITSKDATNLFELLEIFGKIIKFSYQKINEGWNHAKIVGILELLMARGNHTKLRQKGLRLIQSILSKQLNSDPDFLKLYTSAVSLDLFKSPEIKDPGMMSSIGADETGIISNYKSSGLEEWSLKSDYNERLEVPTRPSRTQIPAQTLIPREGAELTSNIEIFQDLLLTLNETAQELVKVASFSDYTTEDLQNAISTEQAVPLHRAWQIFKEVFLRLLFPNVCKAVGMIISNGDGFSLCPKELLEILLDFVCKLSTYDKLADQSPIKDTANGILSTLLAKDSAEFEIINEIVRQGFLSAKLLPKSIYIVSTWLTNANLEQKPFLKSGSNISRYDSNKSLKDEGAKSRPSKPKDSKLNIWIRRYIRYFKMSFDVGPKDSDTLSGLLKEVLQFYRFIACERIYELDKSSWDLLMHELLDLQKSALLNPEISNVLATTSEFNEYAVSITETVLITWIRSKIISVEKWEELEKNLSSMICIKGVALAWTNLAVSLTYLAVELAFGFSAFALKEDHGRHKKARLKHDRGSTPNALNEQGKTAQEGAVATRAASSLASSLAGSEKNEDSLFDPVVGLKLLADSMLFAQTKDLKDLISHNPLLIWKNFLCSIGKVHQIKDPDVHLEILNCYYTVWGIMDRVRNLQSYDHAEMPLLLELGGIFFKAMNMPPEFGKSTAIAAGCVGKMVCRRHDQILPREFLAVYYQKIVRISKQPLDSISYALISSSSKLFSLALPASVLVIPSIVKICSELSKTSPEPFVRASISLLGSLIPYEKQFKEKLTYTEPSTSSDQPIIYSPSPNCGPQERLINLKYAIFESLSKMLKFHADNHNDDYCELILWNLSVLYLELGVMEINQFEDLQNDIIFILLDHISSKELQLVSAAADGLSLICDNLSRVKINEETLIHIIDRLAWGVSENLSIDESAKRRDLVSIASISSLLFQCLLDWLMAAPEKITSNPNIALRISEVIEEAIHVAVVGMDSLLGEQETLMVDNKDVFATNKQETTEMIKIYQHLKESSENIMLHLLHHLGNYSPSYGPAMMNSTISEFKTDVLTEEFESDCCQYFSFHDSTIICVLEKRSESKVRLILRDSTGKYVWDLKTFYDYIDETIADSPPAVPFPIKISRESPRITANSSDSGGFTTHGGDILEQTIINITNNHPECVYLAPDVEGLCNPETEFQQLMSTHINKEIDLSFKSAPPLPAKQPALLNRLPGPFESSRLFLANTGQLSFDHLKEGKAVMLAKTPNLLRDIKGLDKKYSREVAKFALIYVAPGQEDEGAIFRNSSGSLEYDEFVDSLGWKVDLQDHAGYAGGLDATMVTNGIAIYYCTSTIEMIFHDTTRMPTDTSDPKQLKKKRHIGNDHVHIIWNEHYRDYKWETIGGDFGNAQIAITPLHNGLYAIDTYRDDLVRPFGPLQSRSVVTKECLGSLVRATAMNAYRNALCAGAPKGIETHPFTLRKQTIGIISSRHKVPNDSFEKHMTAVITEGMKPVNKSPPPSSPKETTPPVLPLLPKK